MGRSVTFVEGCPKADHRRVFTGQVFFVQVFRKVGQHLPFRIVIASKESKAFLRSEEIPGHFLLPGGEKSGIGGNGSLHSGVDFIPNLGQEHFILAVLGDFFDITALHIITGTIIPQLFWIARKFFLSLGKKCRIITGRKQVILW